MTFKITTKEIFNAVAHIQSDAFYDLNRVQKTPLIYSHKLSLLGKANVFLKCENLQTTGSFKLRGATNAVLNLDPNEKKRGIVTASSGNHGAALAYAAKALGVPSTIFVPEEINSVKENKIASLGAKLVKVDGLSDLAEQEALSYAQNKGLKYISPYNNYDVIVGQASMGLEITESLPKIDAAFISVGGGGLVSGVGSVLKHNSTSKVIGCWPAVACSMLKCMQAGKVIEVEEQTTLSDGTAGAVEPGSITLPLCQEVINSTETVSESEIALAMQYIYDEFGMVIEGSAGVAVAAFIKSKKLYENKNLVIILCGKNIPDEKFRNVLQQHPSNI